MGKLLKDLIKDPKFFTDCLGGKRKISAADYSYFTHNGKPMKILYKIIELCGNKYSGK